MTGKTEAGLWPDFQRFNPKNLGKVIHRVIPIPEEELLQELRQYIFPRLDFLAGAGNHTPFFLFEECYVETEWKDMISIHYINTSYEVKNTVLRIHLFSTCQVQESAYLGCFTMRTINETQIMLSYIYPHWKNIKYIDKALNIMTYKKTVHLNGVEIEFCTYPLFVQDNVVVACAQACLISMSKYLHSKYDYNRIRIENINNSYHSNKTKIFPSQGLLPTQMLEILYSYNIPVGYQVYRNENQNRSINFKEYIDYCVESAIPVLVGLIIETEENVQERHVIQIIGHSDVEDGKKYVVYDDSGYYLKYMKQNGFVGCVEWETLSGDLKENKSFIIYPIHEKVYIPYDNFKKHMSDMWKKLEMDTLLESQEQGNKEDRILLLDNREVKNFLYDNIICQEGTEEEEGIRSEVREEAIRLLQTAMPHYLWCCERSTSMGNLLFVADPTYNRRTTKNIFLNRVPLISNKQVSLLRYDGCDS